MERSTRQYKNKRRRYLPGFLATLLWVSSLMAVLAAGGYVGARFFVAPAMLKDSTVQQDKPHPIRILSPEEAAKSARDTDSHVWTEGVKDSDIPRLEQDEKRTSQRRRSRRVAPTPERTETPVSEPSGNAEPQSAPETTGAGDGAEATPSPSAPAPTAE